MSDIPEDVMKRAEKLLLDGLYGCVSIDSSPYHECIEWDNAEAIRAIARALMEERAAERERCAAIVDAMQADEIREYSIDLQHAARAIRGQP